jgi:hypothetical protein
VESTTKRLIRKVVSMTGEEGRHWIQGTKMLKKILGYLWASPVTFVGLLYTTAFWALGWHTWVGTKGDGLVWKVNHDKAPQWLMNYWKKWGGHAIGNVVVLRDSVEESQRTLTHELKHVDQVMRLGVFQPILYGLNLLAIKYGCPGSDPYYDNPFEIDARRHAGQVIDMTGFKRS